MTENTNKKPLTPNSPAQAGSSAQHRHLAIEIIESLKPQIGHPLSKARQVYLSLYQLVESGTLPYDAQLPPSRQLATQLGVSRNTVVCVYEQLCAEGLLTANGRRGTRVCKQLTPKHQPETVGWSVSKRALSTQAKLNQSHDLTPGEPDTALFPNKKWQSALSTAAKLDSNKLNYRSTALSSTQEAITRYLATYRSLVVDPDQVIVTSGTRQSLALAATVFADPGDQAIAECPGYLGAVEAFRQQGLRVLPGPVGSNGMTMPEAMESQPRIIYLTPCFQYPLGMPLGTEQRTSLLNLSRDSGVVLFEDDYDSEFRDDSQPRAALAAESNGARVLYAGTFSKILFPAVRVGWLVVPKSCIHVAQSTLRALGGGNTTIMQTAVTELLNNGSIAHHLSRARQVYGQRRLVLIDSLADNPWFKSQSSVTGSLTLNLELIHNVNRNALEKAMKEALIGAHPLEKYYWHSEPSDTCKALVIGLGNVQTLGVPNAIERLSAALDQAREQTK